VKVEVVKVTRKYNLGNYESIDVGYEAVLSDVEAGDDANILNCTRQLEGFADQYFQHGRYSRNGTGKQVEQTIAKPTVASPLDEFSEDLRYHMFYDASKDWITSKLVAKELWIKMNDKARELGYKYVSDGKNSRWEKA